MEGGRKPITQESRDRRRAQLMKRRKKIMRIRICIFVIVITAFAMGALFWKKLSPSKEAANLNEYYGIKDEEHAAVILDNRILGAVGKIVDGRTYVEYSVVRDYLNNRVYVDGKENILLYTLADGSIEAHVGSSEYTYKKETYNKEYVLLKMEGDTSYVSLDFVKEYTDIEFETYEEPARIMIVSDWDEQTIAIAKKSTKLRTGADIKSSILTEVAKKDELTIVEKADKWTLVRTKDGVIGYIKNNALKDEQAIVVDRAFTKQVYPNITKNYTINMAWHAVSDRSVNDTVLSTIANTKGLTTVSPTWFALEDVQGNISSLASSDYVNYAHQMGIEVWALIKDFDGEIDTKEEVYEVLSRTTNRTNLINELMSEVFKHDIDGINVDFEHISEECAEHYLQFLRELSVKCRQNGIVLSVDNYVPAPYNSHYNLEEQGEIVDYVIIMGYDEHYEGSSTSGPVSSLSFVEEGIKNALEVVPNEKLINAVPFYTRLWMETKGEEGTEAAEQIVKLESEVYRMKTTPALLEEAGAEIKLDPASGLNYAEWESEGVVYKIWIEDTSSLEARLKFMKQYNLAGISAWRLGYESADAWDLILKYVN